MAQTNEKKTNYLSLINMGCMEAIDNNSSVKTVRKLQVMLKARLHRRFLSQQLNATQCNFCRAEVANSCDFIAILVQFVSVNDSTQSCVPAER